MKLSERIYEYLKKQPESHVPVAKIYAESRKRGYTGNEIASALKTLVKNHRDVGEVYVSENKYGGKQDLDPGTYYILYLFSDEQWEMLRRQDEVWNEL